MKFAGLLSFKDMGRNRAPIGYTCPEINSTIDYLERVRNEITNLEDFNDTDILGEIELECHKNLDFAIELLESLRQANETLRHWGSQMEEKADDLEEKVDDLEEKIDSLNDKINGLKDEINELEKELSTK